MRTQHGKSDRAKASEQAIFLLRELHVPAPKIVSALAHVAKRLNGKVSLVLPSRSTTLPVKLTIEREASDWRIEVLTDGHRPARSFFEGVIRLERDDPNVTGVSLVGRFIFSRADMQRHVDASAMNDFAESNLIEIFEKLLLEVESMAVADKAHTSLN